MAKLIAEHYRQLSSGEKLISAYHVVIKKQVAVESGLIGMKDLNIYAKDGKIIIEKKEDGNND